MKKYIEALLFASTEPLSQSLVNSIFPNEKVNLKEIEHFQVDYRSLEVYIFAVKDNKVFYLTVKGQYHNFFGYSKTYALIELNRTLCSITLDSHLVNNGETK